MRADQAFYDFSLVAAHPESTTAFAYSDGIEAYNLANGNERWRRDLQSSARSLPKPAVANGDTVYVSRLIDNEAELLALDRTSGSERWAVSPSIISGIAVDDSGVYLNDSGTVFMYSSSDGSEEWSTPVTGGTLDLLAAGDTVVRLSSQGRINVLSKADGELLRSAAIGGPTTADNGFAIAGGQLYVPFVNGGLGVYGTT